MVLYFIYISREWLADSGIFQMDRKFRNLSTVISCNKLIFSNICYGA